MTKSSIFFRVISVILFFGVVLASCKDEEKEVVVETLEVSPANGFNFDDKANQGTIEIKSNVNWTITCTETWVTIPTTSGNGNMNVQVSVPEHSLPATRNASITVRTEGGLFETLQLRQLGLAPDILVNPDGEVTIIPLGEDFLFEVTANYQWEVQIPQNAAGWISTKTSSETEAVLAFKANNTGDERTAVVVFKLKDIEHSSPVTIKQEAINIEFPDEATMGDNIDINGSDLLLIEEVWFADKKGTIVEQTDVLITVTIPEEFETEGNVNLKIVYHDGEYELVLGVIELQSPIVPEFTVPATGFIGKTLILVGANLDLIDEVFFGIRQGAIAAGGTSTQIEVTVPTNANEGANELAIVFGGKRVVAGSINLSFQPPQVEFPATGSIGKNITVTGTDLQLITEVLIGGIESQIISNTGDEMVVQVPPTASVGTVAVKVFWLTNREIDAGTITLSAEVPLVLVPPSAGIGRHVTLMGEGLGGVEKVTFGTAEVTITGKTDNSITVFVPTTLAEGDVNVEVTYAGTSTAPAQTQIRLTKNLALHAGTMIEGHNTPRVTTGMQNSSNRAFHAFDGVRSIAQWDWLATWHHLEPVDWRENDNGLTGTLDRWTNRGWYIFYRIRRGDGITGEAYIHNNRANNYTRWEGNGSQHVGEQDDNSPGRNNSLWVTLNYSETVETSVTFNRIVLLASNQPMESYTIEVSENNLNWTKIVLGTESIRMGSNSSTPSIHTLTSPVTAKYVRFVALPPTGSNSGLGSFELYND